MGSQRCRFITLWGCVCMVLIFPRVSSARFREGFGLSGGFYSPSERSTDSIYGSGLMFGVRYQVAVQSNMGLATSIGVLQKKGNAYNDNTFLGVDSPSRLTFVPVELSYIVNLISNAPEVRLKTAAPRIRTLYVGIGANHIWARERVPGSPIARGTAFGGQVLAGANFSISKALALGVELKYLRNQPLMKLNRGSDYRVQLDGAQVHAIVVWHLRS